MRRISAHEYKQMFKLDKERSYGPDDVVANALKQALDTRKFEIELYWQRAKYFWTFIAAALAGFGVVQKLLDGYDKTFLSVVLSCLGVLFSFAWYLVNRGSKLWQENWENHVALLEDSVHGPLLKTILTRDEKQRKTLKYFIIGPAQYSVSKINQLVSLFVTLFWAFFVYYSLPNPFVYDWEVIDWDLGAPVALTGVACIMLGWWGRSDFKERKKDKIDHLIKAMQYKTEIDPAGTVPPEAGSSEGEGPKDE